MKKLTGLLFTILLSKMVFAQQNPENMVYPVVLVIHGGAGALTQSTISPEREKAYRLAMDKALEAGYAILASGGTSLDAVQKAVQVLEDDPLFNAGRGSVYTASETIEMDAAIMDGASGKAGAVAGVSRIKNPVAAARAVMDHSPHVLLSGEGAAQFAEKHGVETADSAYFANPERLDQLRRIRKKEEAVLDHDADQGMQPGTDSADHKYGTVGAVALDRYGNLAAATSTGGMTNKRYGRIGDSPLIGAGTYANRNCAISCTGHGEFFIRNVVAYDVAALLEYKNLSLDSAARYVIHEKLEAQNGRGGLIAVDKSGNITMPFNTEGMFRAYIRTGGEKQVFIYGEK